MKITKFSLDVRYSNKLGKNASHSRNPLTRRTWNARLDSIINLEMRSTFPSWRSRCNILPLQDLPVLATCSKHIYDTSSFALLQNCHTCAKPLFSFMIIGKVFRFSSSWIFSTWDFSRSLVNYCNLKRARWCLFSVARRENAIWNLHKFWDDKNLSLLKKFLE